MTWGLADGWAGLEPHFHTAFIEGEEILFGSCCCCWSPFSCSGREIGGRSVLYNVGPAGAALKTDGF
jgi:hypothetical protein